MAFTHELAMDVLKSIPQYVAEFKTVFGTDEVSIGKVTDAIAAFEETLVTPNSRFDKWLKGDKKAINAKEAAGYALFKNSGCVAFLKTLTGEQPAFKLPQLPPSTNTTPRPKPFE
jgi:cytochrome c peroxidase